MSFMTTENIINPNPGQHFIASGTILLIDETGAVACEMSGINFYLTGVPGLRFKLTEGAEIVSE